MKTFINSLDETKIEAAIAGAELKSSGEIRVAVHPKTSTDAQADAAIIFAKLGMHRTQSRNAVLLFIAPKSRVFAIHADAEIHRLCGEGFWQETAKAMETLFRQGEFTAGIVAGISSAGDQLARHFPRKPDDKNELPDTLIDGSTII